MASVFEDAGREVYDQMQDMALKGAKISKDVLIKMLKVGSIVGGKSIKGLCLILGKGIAFTTPNVMRAVRELAYNKTGNIELSNRNIDMVQLQSSGQVTKVDENLTADVMKYFDSQCKRFGVKYSAMKDERDRENPSYMIFYNGKSADIILQVMKEAYKDYVEAQNQVKNDPEKEKEPQKRESVRAKLAFFRDRVADREKDREPLEKVKQRAELQR